MDSVASCKCLTISKVLICIHFLYVITILFILYFVNIFSLFEFCNNNNISVNLLYYIISISNTSYISCNIIIM